MNIEHLVHSCALKANSGVRKSVGREAYYAQTGMYDANTMQI